MSNTPSKAEIEALVKRHGATSYRNRADTQHPAYGFTEDGLNGLIGEVLAKWSTPQPVVREPLKRVATIKSWTNGSYWRNYNVEWHSDALVEGTQLYAEIPAHGITQKGGD